MNRERTNEQVRADYLQAMGAELGGLFHAVSNELTTSYWRWKQYRTLFGENPSRIDILNEAAPFFFRIIQDVLFEDALLAIARLVGPLDTSGKHNLTIQRFPPLIYNLVSPR